MAFATGRRAPIQPDPSLVREIVSRIRAAIPKLTPRKRLLLGEFSAVRRDQCRAFFRVYLTSVGSSDQVEAQYEFSAARSGSLFDEAIARIFSRDTGCGTRDAELTVILPRGSRVQLWPDVYFSVWHELSHVMDPQMTYWASAQEPPEYIDKDSDLWKLREWKAYYNDRTEVQVLRSEVALYLKSADWSGKSRSMILRSLKQRFGDRIKFLTPENRKKVMSDVGFWFSEMNR